MDPGLTPVVKAAIGVGAVLFMGCSLSLGSAPARSARTPTAGSTSAAPSATTQAPAAATASFDAESVAAVLGPAVGDVIINTRSSTAEGTGFVIAHQNGKSQLATNAHVVSGATKLQVLMPDGQHFTAAVKGSDPVSDVAVIEVPDGNLPLAVFADSTQLKVGQYVVAIGNPLGNEGSVTSGIISALHRSITAGSGGTSTSETLPDVLQTDAAINPGNSGGPLADANGHVVGMTTAGSTSANNIGFAIPSAIVQRISNSLIAGQKPGHPFLGVSITEETDALKAGQNVAGFAVVVQSVTSGCAAAQAGLNAGDLIQTVGGVDLKNGQTLGGVLQLHNPGDQVKLTVLRHGSRVDLTVTLGDQPANPRAGC